MKCIVPSCNNDFHNTTTAPYSKHRFPADKARRAQWIQAIVKAFAGIPLDLTINFDNVLICSDHFAQNCFQQKPGASRKILRKTSIPTLFGAAQVDVKNVTAIQIPEPPIDDREIPEPPLKISKSAKKTKINTRKLIENALTCTQEIGKDTEEKPTEINIFRLRRLPHVCRMCLKPNSRQILMVSLTTKDPALGGESIGDFIAAITSPEVISDQNMQRFLPKSICLPCLELLRFFAKYRSKITTVQLLLNSLVDLKQNNPGPIVDLFNTKPEPVRMVLEDLDLCSSDDYSVQDLLDEFPSYELASFEGFEEEEDTVVQEQKYLSKKSKYKVEESIREPAKNNSDHMVAKSSVDDQVLKTENTSTKRKRGVKKLDEPLHCTKCSYSTYFSRSFRAHQRSHENPDSKVKYACKKSGCTAVFQTYDEYRRHVPVAHKRFICDICGLKFPLKSVLANHMARHENKLEHVCPYCQRRHNTKSDLRTHVRVIHLGTTNYPCDTCGMSFRRKTTRDEHQLSHSEVAAFACSQCDKKFKKKMSLKNHITTVHEKIRIPCPHCDHDFMRMYKLNNHIESVHGIQTRFVCDICVLTFNSQEKLDSHRVRHDNPNELECGTCLMVFPSKDLLSDHLCITYRDDYVCCGRDLRYHSIYNKHMLINHGITTNVRVKPIPGQLMGQMRAQRKRIESCPKCEQIFATRTLKKQHMDICMSVKELGDESDADIGMDFKIE